MAHRLCRGPARAGHGRARLAGATAGSSCPGSSRNRRATVRSLAPTVLAHWASVSALGRVAQHRVAQRTQALVTAVCGVAAGARPVRGSLALAELVQHQLGQQGFTCSRAHGGRVQRPAPVRAAGRDTTITRQSAQPAGTRRGVDVERAELGMPPAHGWRGAHRGQSTPRARAARCRSLRPPAGAGCAAITCTMPVAQ
jgi:hypothetical protein